MDANHGSLQDDLTVDTEREVHPLGGEPICQNGIRIDLTILILVGTCHQLKVLLFIKEQFLSCLLNFLGIESPDSFYEILICHYL